MAIAVVADFPETELAQYDKVIEILGYEDPAKTPAGLLFHWATKTPEGVRTVDIWSDRETAEAHAEADIGPAAAEAGITVEPKLAYIPVHNYVAGATAPVS
jgi:hypothetical protein